MSQDDKQRELLREALEALSGVIRVADRKTVEFDAARAAADKIRAALEHQP
jgi:ATP phosphoribosyltransferase